MKTAECLVLGIGNILMGDEGVGVHVARGLPPEKLPPEVICMDGGTGGFHLLGPLQEAERVILVDATVDGKLPGTVTRLEPRYSADYPRTLTAHDIGLKDLLDALYLSGEVPEITLFAVSIDSLGSMSTDLSPAMASRVPRIVELVLEEVGR